MAKVQRYKSNACEDCKRRKVKCSGHVVEVMHDDRKDGFAATVIVEHGVKKESGEIRNRRTVLRPTLDALSGEVRLFRPGSSEEDIQRDYRTSAVHELSHCGAVAEFLRRMRDLAPVEDSVYIHPQPLTFGKKEQKETWESFPGTADVVMSDTFAGFLRAAKLRPNGSMPWTWIAILETPVTNWIGDRKWQTRPWHTWAVAIAHDVERRARLIIYDCDVPAGRVKNMKPKEFRGAQQAMFKLVRQRIVLNGVYFGNWRDNGASARDVMDRSGPKKKNRCTQNTMYWLHRIAVRSDQPFNSDAEQWKGLVRVEGIGGYLFRQEKGTLGGR